MWVSCQAPFRIRGEVARLLELAESRVRVIAPDVGGGFGVKTGPYREDVLLAWLARRARPPRQVGGDAPRGPGHDQPGARLGLRGRAGAGRAAGASPGCAPRSPRRSGAHLMNAAAGSPWNHARCMPGAYVIPSCDITVDGALTTTAPVSAYRGAGRPEACFFIERLMDTAARAMQLDPAELRRRNFIAADRFPYKTITGQVYDSGDYPQALDRALAAADYDGLRRRQAERRAKGEIVGVGLASYVEPCALGWESGSIRVERSGKVTAITGSSAHGQGHETTFAQVVADHLGVTPGGGHGAARRHALGPRGLRHLRQPQHGPGRRRARAHLGGSARQGPPHRGPAAGGGAGGHRAGARRLPGGGRAAASAWRGRRWPPRPTRAARPCRRATRRGSRPPRTSSPSGEVWSSGAVVCGLSIERETGRAPPRAAGLGGRRGDDHQSAAGRGPAPRRAGPGPGPGPDGGDRLRRGRAVPDQHADGLRDPARRRRAGRAHREDAHRLAAATRSGPRAWARPAASRSRPQ